MNSCCLSMLTGYCPQICHKCSVLFPFFSFLSFQVVNILSDNLFSNAFYVHKNVRRMWDGDFHLPLCVCRRLKDNSYSKLKFTLFFLFIWPLSTIIFCLCTTKHIYFVLPKSVINIGNAWVTHYWSWFTLLLSICPVLTVHISSD